MKNYTRALCSLLMIGTSVAAYAKTTDQLSIPEVLTMDTHVDIPYNFATPMVDAARDLHQQVSLDKMEAGGLNAAFFIVYVDQEYRNDWEYEAVKKASFMKFEAIHRMVRTYPERVGLALTADDVSKIAETGKRVALIGIENGFAIGKDINLLQRYYDLGARYITLIHNGHNDIGDSAQPLDHFGDAPEEHGGLSAYGREVIAKMNELGIMVDVSHAAKTTMMQAAKISKTPVIASHSGVRALVDHPRNMDDEQLLAMKKAGGVVQITAVDLFLQQRSAEYNAAVENIRQDLGLIDFHMERTASPELLALYHLRLKKEVDAKWRRASVKDLVDQIDYVVKLIGIDYVGIASDFDGGGGIEGWDDASETSNVTRELVARGYNEQDIAKIWGGNLLRVMRRVEQRDGR
ncbi:dipeptidase [Paremcibacter congregatus]|uniref:Dipeptidase n=1 Tax=Paremcibacter congregatus TaxID=2043170 RepID=A0A2G4YQR3_9PROT|nr:dipeptidase [Paremcibacter congregatus]PHZ84662.1 dipeptidase [Paremcibacter congregatus]QDE28858.1 membrane dipeptidase [Paremcibacter congregatus]